MCSLCGVLGGKVHWTEGAGAAGSLAEARLKATRASERQERVRLLNLVLRPFSLTIDDWAGTSYIVRTRTGQSALVENLARLWAAAEHMQKRACDPLDPHLIAALGGGAPGAEPGHGR